MRGVAISDDGCAETCRPQISNKKKWPILLGRSTVVEHCCTLPARLAKKHRACTERRSRCRRDADGSPSKMPKIMPIEPMRCETEKIASKPAPVPSSHHRIDLSYVRACTYVAQPAFIFQVQMMITLHYLQFLCCSRLGAPLLFLCR